VFSSLARDGVLAIAKRAITVDSSVVAAKNQVSSDLGGEVAILDLEGGTYYGLDAVGARIWDLIQEPKTVEEIRNVLLEEYEVESERCERDVIRLLQELAEEGLVEVEYGALQ
jgi:coenzyme PQQ synthesis protein D (PqqD)